MLRYPFEDFEGWPDELSEEKRGFVYSRCQIRVQRIFHQRCLVMMYGPSPWCFVHRGTSEGKQGLVTGSTDGKVQFWTAGLEKALCIDVKTLGVLSQLIHSLSWDGTNHKASLSNLGSVVSNCGPFLSHFGSTLVPILDHICQLIAFYVV